MTQTVKIEKIEDHEGDGFCQECGREGLRWIARLSDGRSVGLECAKKVVGFRPAPKSYSWVADYVAIAEHDDYGDCWVLYRHRTGARTVETRNGALMGIGGAERTWKDRGWL